MGRNPKFWVCVLFRFFDDKFGFWVKNIKNRVRVLTHFLLSGSVRFLAKSGFWFGSLLHWVLSHLLWSRWNSYFIFCHCFQGHRSQMGQVPHSMEWRDTLISMSLQSFCLLCTNYFELHQRWAKYGLRATCSLQVLFVLPQTEWQSQGLNYRQ